MTDRPDTPDADRPLPAAAALIEAFGGIRPMAAKLDIPVTTVQGWKERDSIPKRRWAEIRAAAAARGIALDTPAAAGTDEAAPEAAEAEQPGTLAPPDDQPWAASAPEDEAIAERAASEAPGGEAEAAATEAAPPPPPPRSRRGVGLWPWFLLAVLAGAVAATWDLWWPMVEREADMVLAPASDVPGQAADRPAATGESASEKKSASDEQPQTSAEAPASAEPAEGAAAPAGSAAAPSAETDLSALEAEVAALKKAVDGLQAGAGGDDAAAQRIAALEKQVQGLTDSLDARFAGLETRSDAEGLESALAELRAENARLTDLTQTLDKSLKALESRLAAAEKRAGAQETMMLAVGQLRAAFARGAAFVTELRLIESLSSEDPEIGEAIAKLWPYAHTGVETEAELRSGFEVLVPKVLAAEHAAAGDWTGRVLAKLTDVVTVRRVGGEVEGEGADAVLARAEALLEDGDLSAAVRAMAALEGAPAQAAASWLSAARARLAAEGAVAVLESKALADSAPAEG